jgi:cysteine synthase
MKIAQNILPLVGKTPLVWLNRISAEVPARIAVKMESMNPCSSVKDRLGIALIEDAEKKGLISKDTIIIEPTSGNTGIGLAMACAVKGYKLIVVMPESMSIERRKLLSSLGAEIVLTPAAQGVKGSVEKANEMKLHLPSAYIPQQFNNPANYEMHRQTTALEIWDDTSGQVDCFVCGVGSGGTITGVGEVLKERKKTVSVIAVEPDESPVISGGTPAPHKIQGIGPGFVPGILNLKILDEVIRIKGEEAIKMTRRLIREEGILCGISSGANVLGAMEWGSRPTNKGKLIVTLICDTGERYLSTPVFE